MNINSELVHSMCVSNLSCVSVFCRPCLALDVTIASFDKLASSKCHDIAWKFEFIYYIMFVWSVNSLRVCLPAIRKYGIRDDFVGLGLCEMFSQCVSHRWLRGNTFVVEFCVNRHLYDIVNYCKFSLV